MGLFCNHEDCDTKHEAHSEAIHGILKFLKEDQGAINAHFQQQLTKVNELLLKLMEIMKVKS